MGKVYHLVLANQPKAALDLVIQSASSCCRQASQSSLGCPWDTSCCCSTRHCHPRCCSPSRRQGRSTRRRDNSRSPPPLRWRQTTPRWWSGQHYFPGSSYRFAENTDIEEKKTPKRQQLGFIVLNKTLCCQFCNKTCAKVFIFARRSIDFFSWTNLCSLWVFVVATITVSLCLGVRSVLAQALDHRFHWLYPYPCHKGAMCCWSLRCETRIKKMM